MAYLLFAVMVAAVIWLFLWARFRSVQDPSRSVHSFQRAIRALEPPRRQKRR